MQGRGIPRGDHLGVADHDRHDGHPGGHGEPERTLLERAHRFGVQPGALRRDDNRQPLLGQLLGLLQRLDGLLRVVAINEYRVNELAQSSDHRVVLEFLLSHPGPVVLDHRGDQHRVEVVAVVEDEHRGPLLLEVLLTQYVQPHPVEAQQQLRKRRGEEVHAATPTTGQQSPADGAVGSRNDGPHADQGAHLPHQTASSTAVELQDRPAPLAGYLSHLVSRIGRPGVADQLHQRDVLVAVGVEVAVRQVDVVLGGELLHGAGLARSPQNGLDHLSGEQPVDVDLEPVAQGVGDTQEARHRFDLDGERRGAEHHGVAVVEVGLHQFAHLGIDALLDLLGEQPLTDLLQIRQWPPAQHLGGLVDQTFEFDPAELMVETGGHHADQFPDAHVAVADPLPGENHPGEAGDQRAVEVEERPHPRAGRTGHHLCHRSGKPHLLGLVTHE